LRLPKIIADRKAVLNIKNEDNECFLYCVAAHLYPSEDQKHAFRSHQYRQHFDKFDTTGLTFPMTVDQLNKFERQNPQIGINVVTIEGDDCNVVPLYASKFVNQRPNHANLLMFSGINDNGAACTHFALVKSLSRLLSYASKRQNKVSVCPFCLHRYYKQELLDRHILDCGNYPPLKIIFPKSSYSSISAVKKNVNS